MKLAKADPAPGLVQPRSYLAAWRCAGRCHRGRISRSPGDGVRHGGGAAAGRGVVGVTGADGRLRGNFWSSRQLSVGPESTTALMTATALAPLAVGDPARYAVLAAVLAVLVGGICLVGGLCRLGFPADLLSRPVLVGYMTGVAVIMVGGQLGRVSGVPVHGDEFADQIRSSSPTSIPGTRRPCCCRGRCSRPPGALPVAPGFPGPLVAVLLASVAVAVFSLERNGTRVVGPIPSGPPAVGSAGRSGGGACAPAPARGGHRGGRVLRQRIDGADVCGTQG